MAMMALSCVDCGSQRIKREDLPFVIKRVGNRVTMPIPKLWCGSCGSTTLHYAEMK